MADIAVVFHWPLESMDALSLLELAEWRQRADVRATPEDDR